MAAKLHNFIAMMCVFHSRMRWLLLIVPALAMAASAEPRTGLKPDLHLERTPIAGGAEIITVFSSMPDQSGEVPLVAVLRDTLGDNDPANDKLRYVWNLTATSPSVLQRVAGATPFLYFRPNLGRKASKKPSPVIDLGNPARNVWNAFTLQAVQWAAMDSNGALIRASTRRYRTNLTDRRRVHLAEGQAVLSQLETLAEAQELFTENEMLEMQARMALAGQMLGGLASSEKLPKAYFSQRSRSQEWRGHNWELLRQRAEANGLYFDPMGLGESRTHALVWIAKADIGSDRSFDAKFLDIGNPYRDVRLKDWKGVTVTRYFDATGREVAQDAPGAMARELIPLGMYGLDYPKIPLLLIDFRNTYAPKRREMLARATADVVMGMFGYSRWGNWPYMAGSMAWEFARTRRGAATNAEMRLKSYSEVRRLLALDPGMTPELRSDVQQRMETLGVNPLEESVREQMETGRKQYAALMEYAKDPQGLRVRLDADRASELTGYEHNAAARVGLKAANILTLGLFRHREPEQGEDAILALDEHRRAIRPAQPKPHPAALIYAAGN